MSRLETVLSKRNTTVLPLAANAEWVGDDDELSSFSEIDVTIAGAPSSAAGTFTFEFSPDGTNWDVSVSLALAGPVMTPLPLRVIMPRFRIRYLNGVTPQTELRITTVLHRSSAKNLTRFLSQPLAPDLPIEVIRAVVAGQKPDGSFINLQLTEFNQIMVAGPLTDTQLRAAAVPVSGPLTDAEVRATPLPVSGTVAVSNFPATQPVSGPLTDAQLRASAVPVALDELDLQTAYDLEETQSGVLYVGTAVRGALTSSAAWKIKRTILNINGDPVSTKKTNSNAVWDNRTTETYT